ncbi:MAG: hypothetical protein Q4C73_04160 [Eubacteriales bacterium]|nr:hypothetical protein [Eubacteriales bacterium]
MERQKEYVEKLKDRRWLRWQLMWKTDLLVLAFLLGFAVLVNHGIELKGLFMDDLNLWYANRRQPFMEAVFPIGSSRFRFVHNFVSWAQMWLFGPHVNWYVPFNILVNTGIAFTLYFMARRLSRSVYVGVICPVMYLASRMAYYQISQVLGLMEAMALWLAVMILFLLYLYLNEQDGKESRRIYLAAALYVIVCFVHERYMVLLPVIFLALLMKRAKRWQLWAAPAGGFLLVQAIRFLTIGTVLPAGTGGTEVVDTFKIGTVFRFVMCQIGYIFGINAGPGYLNGETFTDAPIYIMLLIGMADLMLLLLVTAWVIRMIQCRKTCVRHLQTAALFVAFIGACVACSSVTFRLEMRWVYVSFTACLLFMAWMYGVLVERCAEKGRWVWGVPFLAMITAYAVLMLPVELYYRGTYPNLYYWRDQQRYNSLAEQTYWKYGDEIFDKTVYIVGDKWEQDEFVEDNFFKVFDPLLRADSTKIVHIDDVRQIGQITDAMLVLQEEPDHDGYADVTRAVKTIKCRPVYGYYDADGWTDERAEIQVMAGSTGQIVLHCDYPLELQEDQWLTVYLNGEASEYINFDTNVKEVTLNVRPYEVATLRFETNFFVPDAQEKRGTTRLAFLLTITAD